MSFFAQVFDSANAKFIPWEFELPQLKPGEVLVEMTCCTICGSDLHTFTGRRAAPRRCILGHETIGKVAAWGGSDVPADARGASLSIGDRVTWCMANGCGDCFYCRNHLNQKCEDLFKYGHEAADDAPTGGLSEYCLLRPGTAIFQVPRELTDLVACPANCATATVVAALRLSRQTHPIVDQNVLVVGAGMLGLNAIAQLSDIGARQIIVADPDPDRRDWARRFGATHVFEKANLSSVKDVTDGRGADVVLDFAGVTPAVEACFESIRVGGLVLLAGSVFPSKSISLTPESIVRRMLVVRGLHNYLPGDLAKALDFLERKSNDYPFEELITQSFELSDVEKAFQFALDHRPVRIAVTPNHPIESQ